LLAIGQAAFCASAIAYTQTGTVNYVIVRSTDGLVYFQLSGTRSGAGPACATGSYWAVRDENSNSGKQQYALLLAAQAAGKTVTVTGTGFCARWNDSEDVDWVKITD
jgi:hypothetical protein